MSTTRFFTALAAFCVLSAGTFADEYEDYYRTDSGGRASAGRETGSLDRERLDVNLTTTTVDGLTADAYDDESGECCNSCGESLCCGGCGSDRLFGIIAPTDHAFDDFISPITNPAFFEDPRTLTEWRFMFLNQVIPESQPLFQGGDFQLWAMQFRIALTKRLSIIAAKDGYINLHTDATGDFDGWGDVAAGLKYNLIRDPAAQTVVSGGFTWEIDLGDHQVFQGRGDGEVHLFLTGGTEIAPYVHWLSGTGFRIPTDHTARSQMWYWSNHWDAEFLDGIYGLIELNWYHWMRSGQAVAANFEGGDLINLGSNNVAGNDIVTFAFGGKWKPCDSMELGAAWEFPLTDRRDLLHDRATVDMILRY